MAARRNSLNAIRPLTTEKRNHFDIYTLIFFVIMTLYGYYIVNVGANENYNRIIGWMGIATLVWCAVSMKVITKTFMSLPFMFEAAFYILTLGQSGVIAFKGNIDDLLNLYYFDSPTNVNRAYIFSILCLIALNFGIVFAHNNTYRFNFKLKSDYKPSVDYTKAMKTVGIIMAVVSFVPYVIMWYHIVSTYSYSGYTNAFISISGSTSWSKIPTLIGEYFPIALYMLLAAYKDEKQKRNIVIALIVANAILNLSVGNRSEPISDIMVVLWFVRNQAVTPAQKRRTTIYMLIGALIFLLIVPVIGETRNEGTLSVGTVINSFTSEGAFASSIEDTIVGMGWSAFPAVKTMQIIPNKIGFHHGESYFFALLSVFPNIFGGTHISVKYAGLPKWLQETLRLPYGPGFSAPAEAFYNFGWYGMFVMPIIGYFAYKLLSDDKKRNNALHLFVMIASFTVLFSFPRREMLTFVRTCTYQVGLSYLAVRIFYRIQRGRG